MADELNYETVKRPVLITIICGYFFVNWVMYVIKILLFSLLYSQIKVSWTFSKFSSLEEAIPIIMAAIIFVAIIGLWQMRKWGILLYALANVASFSYVLYGLWPNDFMAIAPTAAGYLFPLFVIISGFYYFKKMIWR